MSELAEKRELKNFIIDSIDRLWKQYDNNLKQSIENFTEESVHDIRVIIRRYIALIDLLRELFQNKYLEDARMIFRKQIKIFNPLRDTQVQLIKVSELLNSYPCISDYHSYLVNNEGIMKNNIMESLKDFERDELEGLIFFIKLHIKQNFQKHNISMNLLFSKAHNAFQYMMYLYKVADTQGLETIHKVRLAFKKFRYMMEILQPLAPKKVNLKGMKTFQTILGNIQDNRVILINLHFFMEQQNYSNKDECMVVENELLKQRNELIDQFLSQYDLLESFWKPEYLDDKAINKQSSMKKIK
ncbi:MAG: CHAD domain-containing protein [FCB group bacterium]|jgi:CHAD domain-containing protein